MADIIRFKENRALAKNVSYIIIAIISLVLCGQLIAQLLTIKQFTKVTGKIVDRGVRVTSYTSGTKYSKGSPNHSLVVTLDNLETYNVELDDSDWGISDLVNKGDNATIYVPTSIYNLLSLDTLNYGDQVAQFEVNGKILYSFDHHKHGDRSFIIFLLLAYLPFLYYLYDFHKNPSN